MALRGLPGREGAGVLLGDCAATHKVKALAAIAIPVILPEQHAQTSVTSGKPIAAMIQPQRSPSGALSLSISTYRPPLRRAESCSGLSGTLPLTVPLVAAETVSIAEHGSAHAGQRAHAQVLRR